MKEDVLTGGVSPDVTNPLMDAPIHIDDDVELIVEDIFNLPSPHIAPEQMLQNQRTHPVGSFKWNRWRSCHSRNRYIRRNCLFSRYNDRQSAAYRHYRCHALQ